MESLKNALKQLRLTVINLMLIVLESNNQLIVRLVISSTFQSATFVDLRIQIIKMKLWLVKHKWRKTGLMDLVNRIKQLGRRESILWSSKSLTMEFGAFAMRFSPNWPNTNRFQLSNSSTKAILINRLTIHQTRIRLDLMELLSNVSGLIFDQH